jgi:hypothetical protein
MGLTLREGLGLVHSIYDVNWVARRGQEVLQNLRALLLVI